MTEIVLQSPSHLPSSPSLPTHNDGLRQQTLFNGSPTCSSYSVAVYREEGGTEGEEGRRERKDREKLEDQGGDQLSLSAVFVTVFRKSSLLVACRSNSTGGLEEFSSSAMEIGLPTNVRHVAHVTFDRFDGFLGLPVEFEPEVPRRPPSASTRVFGVSTESMQLSFDSRGNSVPTILLMMQRRLYEQGGLQAEGIFRITAGNSQEEYVREQLNSGVVPDNIDVHCLAGLIKAWFRELPNGLLDTLPAEDVLQAQSEEECAQLVRRLPPTEASLLDWAINLMADVSQLENHNKMNARNIAMVFAPNMTQMADPLTALMYAVQVMNFLKTLIEKTLREREDSIVEQTTPSQTGPYDDNGQHYTSPEPLLQEINEVNEDEHTFLATEPSSESPTHHGNDDSKLENLAASFLTSIENIIPGEKRRFFDKLSEEITNKALVNVLDEGGSSRSYKGAQRKKSAGQTNTSNLKRLPKKVNAGSTMDKSKGTSIISRLNPGTERVETWR